MAREAATAGLPVMESFYTIQGEGAYAGHAAFFIRLGGCDVGCHWCDVKESWDASKHPYMDVDSICTKAAKENCDLSVITGGEPFMYDLSELTDGLKSRGIRTHVETAGVYPLTGDWDWIVFSPKKFKSPISAYYEQSHELKVVLYNKSDFKWAEEHATKMQSGAKLYLQPEWSRTKQMTPLIVDYVKKNPHWKVSLQTHKYMDIP